MIEHKCQFGKKLHPWGIMNLYMGLDKGGIIYNFPEWLFYFILLLRKLVKRRI